MERECVNVFAKEGLTEFELSLVSELKKKEIPTIAVINKCDLHFVSDSMVNDFTQQFKIPLTRVSSKNLEGIEELKLFIAENAVYDESDLNILRDLINPGDTVVLITHIDCSAPRGRIILPQQQTIRDIIDAGANAVVTQEKNVAKTLSNLKEKPALVVTDSLVSALVSLVTPLDYKLTSFSVLIGRQKGDLEEFVRGLKRIKNLKEGSRILIVETCTHHRQEHDLGRAQIPNYVKALTGKAMCYEWASGTLFPRHTDKYDGIIHCGGCMVNKQEMKSRIKLAQDKGVPITNYGILIAHAQGILNRILEPFPSALATWENA